MTSILTTENENNRIQINANLTFHAASNTYKFSNGSTYADINGTPLRPPVDELEDTFIYEENPLVTFYSGHYDSGNSSTTESILVERSNILTQNTLTVCYSNTQVNALGTYVTTSNLQLTPNTLVINSSANSSLMIKLNSIGANSNTSNSTLKFELGFVVNTSQIQISNIFSNSTQNVTSIFLANNIYLGLSNTFANSTANVTLVHYLNSSNLVISNTFVNSVSNSVQSLVVNKGYVTVSNTSKNSSVNSVSTFLANTGYLVVSNAYVNSTHTVNTQYSANDSYFGLLLSDANSTYTTNTTLVVNVNSINLKSIEPQYLSTGADANTRTRNLSINVSGISGNISIANSTVTVNTNLYFPFSTAPVNYTDDFTVASTDNWIIINKSTNCTITLPTPSASIGRSLTVKTITAHGANSATNNVLPIGNNTANSLILASTIGKWATLVSDGTNWVIMQAN
jgi:hypothetical protein